MASTPHPSTSCVVFTQESCGSPSCCHSYTQIRSSCTLDDKVEDEAHDKGIQSAEDRGENTNDTSDSCRDKINDHGCWKSEGSRLEEDDRKWLGNRRRGKKIKGQKYKHRRGKGGWAAPCLMGSGLRLMQTKEREKRQKRARGNQMDRLNRLSSPDCLPSGLRQATQEMSFFFNLRFRRR